MIISLLVAIQLFNHNFSVHKHGRGSLAKGLLFHADFRNFSSFQAAFLNERSTLAQMRQQEAVTQVPALRPLLTLLCTRENELGDRDARPRMSINQLINARPTRFKGLLVESTFVRTICFYSWRLRAAQARSPRHRKSPPRLRTSPSRRLAPSQLCARRSQKRRIRSHMGSNSSRLVQHYKHRFWRRFGD